MALSLEEVKTLTKVEAKAVGYFEELIDKELMRSRDEIRQKKAIDIVVERPKASLLTYGVQRELRSKYHEWEMSFELNGPDERFIKSWEPKRNPGIATTQPR